MKMKKVTLIMLMCLLVLGTMTVVQAATNKGEEYAEAYLGGAWNSAYATAYFDYESGRFDHHGLLERISQPSSTWAKQYSAFRVVVSTELYSTDHKVVFKYCIKPDRRCDIQTKVVTIHSPGSY